jgi:dihydrofolate reductase
MGKIVSNFFISLDGVVERPDQWHFSYFDDEMGAIVGAGMESAEAWLMGRVLYDEWSQYWPAHAEDDGFGPFITTIPKYVVSTTLDPGQITWANTSLVTGDVAARLRGLKDSVTGDIGISGSATLVRSLLGAGLLDELHLLVHPVAVGHGQRLFEGVPTTPLSLLSSRALGSGVLYLVYGPRR